MRKAVLFSIIVLLITSLSWAEQRVTKVEVVNELMPVVMDGTTVTVDNDKEDPVPVIMTNGGQKAPMSEYLTYHFEGGGPQIQDIDLLTTVPEGKIFVLTDMLAGQHRGSQCQVVFSLLEDGYLKYREVDHGLSFNLTTGIVFSPGSRVHIKLTDTTEQPAIAFSDGSIFISGFLISK